MRGPGSRIVMNEIYCINIRVNLDSDIIDILLANEKVF